MVWKFNYMKPKTVVTTTEVN